MKKLLLAGLLSLFAFPSFAITQPTQSTTIADVDTVEQSSCITISNNLRYRTRDASVNNEVSDLQDFLNMKGYLSSEPTGYFGLATFRAVKKFQSASGFSPTGYVGPLTRAKISALTCGESVATPTTTQTSTPIAIHPQTQTTTTPTVSLTAYPTTIALGQSSTLTLSSANAGGGCSGVLVTDGKTFGTTTVSPTQTTSYGVTCYEFPYNGGRSASTKVTVSVVPATPVSSLTVLSPNGGETWTKGATQTIKWQDNSPVVSCKSDSTTGVTICPAPTLYFYDIKLFVPPASSSCGAGMLCAQYLPVPYTIAKNVSGSSYSWSVGKFDLYNTGIVGVTNTVPDGAYTIQVCQAGTDTCDSSDSYFKIVSSTSANTSPVINAIPAIPTDLSAGQTITLGWGATDTDNDDLSWSVSWGDGSGVSPTFGCTMSNPQNKQNWNFKASHAWEKSGTYIVKATVTDCKGTSNDHSLSVVVGSSVTPVPTAPTISSINPSQGSANTTVTIYGTNLAGYSTIEFYNSSNQNVASIKSPNSSNSTQTQFLVDSITAGMLGAGTYQIGVVTNACAGGCNSNRVGFTLTAPDSNSPTISTISPNQGSANTTVTIYGTNLAGYSTIEFYNSSNQNVASIKSSNSSNSTQTQFFVDSITAGMLGAGTYQIRVLTTSGRSDALPFILIAPSTSAPTITYISPTSGSSGGGVVTINGTNLNGVTEVTFYYNKLDQNGQGQVLQNITNVGGTTNIKVLSNNQLQVTIPESSAYGTQLRTGTRYMLVYTPSGGQSNAVPFTFLGVSAPGVPTNVSATPGNAQATISFTPSTIGGVATNYAATCKAGSLTIYSPTLTTTSPITFTGLTNGTTYSCYVVAHNSAGDSGVSASVVVTPQASIPTASTQSSGQLAGILGAFTKTSLPTPTQTPTPVSKLEYEWTRNLEVNSPYRDDVTALQIALAKEGVFSGEATGGFYSQTYLAVKAFQAKYGIESTGFVGPITRAKLNELY